VPVSSESWLDFQSVFAFDVTEDAPYVLLRCFIHLCFSITRQARAPMQPSLHEDAETAGLANAKLEGRLSSQIEGFSWSVEILRSG